MLNSNPAVVSLGNAELLASTREILRRGCVVEADLLVHLAEIEERRLHSEIYGRNGGRCTFADERGHRCKETGFLEFDHLDGFARTHLHDPERIVLRCRAHNQHEAEKMYGREFMERARAKKASPSTAVDSVSQQPLFAPQGPELVEAKSRSAQPGR